MKRMSLSKTVPQMRDRTKTVTRRTVGTVREPEQGRLELAA